MEFRPIECKDKDIIAHYTNEANISICDLSFCNLYSWGFLYHTSWAVIAEHLVIRFYRTHNTSHPLYLFPIGRDESPQALREVIELLAEEAEKGDYPLTLMGITSRCHQLLEEVYPEQFTFFTDRDWCDYIYTREKLATLAGKKLQSRRNFVNRFKSTYPDYSFEEINSANEQECLQLAQDWNESKSEADKAKHELTMIQRAMEQREAIGLYGGAIRVDGRVVAFSLGMPINKDTFGVSIEKADASIPGTFAIINNEMAKHIPEQYTYINREEDLGIEGLRKAKLQYKPDILLCKETAILRTGNNSVMK
ncbi:Uncharacterized conserved protein [Porphyromonas crevioricanis]|uniref:Uncharacterized conserved protein n=1 Tax=Porphyromonas crevioricanis TaxID=393921 RepID=A0A2X4SUA6_9PORP|nr:phosphatidylglycerol lysyltransferase domain-containing protein [Porphyromonas crevioricanis]GAD08186.1 hypothetical protein PORCAN_1822 [Porphyromonas crevioricanis JCM 13913]SQH73401.1 Uncharacterized conserved protein [Porphyromonas crevioricanis]